MNRLTHKARCEAGYKLNEGVPAWQAADALGAYENNGLNPAEITAGKLLTGWIPVEERLPDDNCDVLVTNGTYVYEDCYDPTDGCFEKVDNVIAWMPLPEPYKPEN